jgi:4-aminobutyrate aminotransferase-like enzyme
VAAATALAVLEVVENEGLMQNARAVGGAFADGLRGLAKAHGSLGELRAVGLFLGQDIVDGEGQPDATKAGWIVNRLREEGVLISATGPKGHVLKIRPPLVFSHENVAFFLERLERVLKTG